MFPSLLSLGGPSLAPPAPPAGWGVGPPRPPAPTGRGPPGAPAWVPRRRIMRTDFVTVAPEDTIGEAAQKMVDAGRGAAIVSDFGRLIGILTDRDVLRSVAARTHSSEERVRSG